MKTLKMIFAAVFMVTITACALDTGENAPDFELKAADGKMYKLSDFKGKTVVLETTNLSCPFIRKFYDAGAMQKYQAKAKKDGVVWLSICASAKGKQGYMKPSEINKKLKELKAAPTAYLIDADGKVGKKYGMKTTPHIFIISDKGSLVYQGAIDSIKSTNSDDIPKATNYLQQALAEIAAGKKVSVPKTKSYGCSVKY